MTHDPHSSPRRAAPPPFDVAIIGGGLAGLTAATYLGRAGIRTVVLERGERLGGRARTQVEAGRFLNQGPHALYRAGAAHRILRELEVPVAGGCPSGRGGVIRDGRWHTLPGDPIRLLRSRLLTSAEKLEVARFMARIAFIPTDPWNGVPVSRWLEEQFRGAGSRALIAMMVRLTTYCDAPEHLSAGAALRQLALGGKGVLYIHGGWATLVEGLAERARERGATLRTSCSVGRVERIDRAGMADAFVLYRSDGSEACMARRVLFAGSPGLAKRMLGSALASSLPAGRSVEAVRAAGLDLVLPISAEALPHPERLFALGLDEALYFSVHSANAHLAPVGQTLIHVARYLPVGAALRSEQDRALLERMVERVQPGTLERASFARFLPAMIVQNTVVRAADGGESGRPDVAHPDLPGLYFAGDWVGPTGLLADASLASAHRAARRIVGDTTLRRAPAAATAA